MYITNRLSEKITDILAEDNPSVRCQRELYSYCLEYVFEILLYGASIVMAGTILHQTIFSLIYFIVLFLLRSFGGGIHAGTQAMCSFLSYSCFFLTYFIVFCLPEMPKSVLALAFLNFTVIICLCAPVENKNKPLTADKRHYLRKKMHVFTFVLTLSYFVFYYMDMVKYCETINICSAITLACMAGGMLESHLKKKEEVLQ